MCLSLIIYQVCLRATSDPGSLGQPYRPQDSSLTSKTGERSEDFRVWVSCFWYPTPPLPIAQCLLLKSFFNRSLVKVGGFTTRRSEYKIISVVSYLTVKQHKFVLCTHLQEHLPVPYQLPLPGSHFLKFPFFLPKSRLYLCGESNSPTHGTCRARPTVTGSCPRTLSGNPTSFMRLELCPAQCWRV